MGNNRCILGFLAGMCVIALPALAAEPPSVASAPPTVALSAPPGTSGVLPVTGADYKVAADDILQLTVWGEPAVQNVILQVTPEGVVSAPVVGTIAAAGRTIGDIKNDIANKFIELNYLRQPTVQLTLYSIHKMKVRVLGQVLRPGLQLMRDGDKVDQAVAEAGSFIPDSAGLAKATITRLGAASPIPVDLDAFYRSGDFAQNIELKDGDTLYIPEDTENRYYVMGHVT
ncbi:MAG: polysaccharide biosynthesis/export family protein, partial [Armatimonadota bacterium]